MTNDDHDQNKHGPLEWVIIFIFIFGVLYWLGKGFGWFSNYFTW